MGAQPPPVQGEEAFVPLEVGPGGVVPPARRFRSTMIGASVLTLRTLGRFDAYIKHVPAEHRETILGSVAGTWLDYQVGVAHYRAADALGLTNEEQLEIGRDVGRRVHATIFGTMAKLARTAGVTPWTGLAQQRRLWSGTIDGGAVAVYKLGPKEARFEAHGVPELVAIPYFRNAFRGIYVRGSELFCKKMYVSEISSFTRRGIIAYRLAWV